MSSAVTITLFSSETGFSPHKCVASGVRITTLQSVFVLQSLGYFPSFPLVRRAELYMNYCHLLAIQVAVLRLRALTADLSKGDKSIPVIRRLIAMVGYC